ncbi:MAG: tetratricopeptide repeat protein [Bacteroidaceae bacterium]|nr:tetratricopeptide repeat protein [Bacteroidaceae bacterium]
MLDKDTFRQLADSVESELIGGHLHGALTLLVNLLTTYPVPGLKREVNTIQTDYEQLLHYMTQGFDDPSRESQHTRFIQKAYRALQNLRHTYLTDNEHDVYSTTARLLKNIWKEQFDTSMTLPNGAPTFDEQDQLFDLIWVSAQLNSNEERQLRLYLVGVDANVRCYMLSALSLSLLHYFDAAKMRLLMEYATAEEERECARAVVGICIASQFHSAALTLYPKIHETLQQMTQSKDFIGQLTHIQHHFCLYRESERLQKKMEHEILPALIKASQERAKLGFEEETEVNLSDPESGLNLSKDTRKKINESAKEMFQMFQEGVDLNLPTFTALKMFPFFRRVCHWLAPFDGSRPEAATTPMLRKIQPNLCDSDRYSLSLLTTKMPQAQRSAMDNMLKEHTEDIEENTKETQPMNACQNVLQCLYRLLRRSPWQTLWPDVFAQGMLFVNHPVFGATLRKSPEFLHTTGITLLRHDRYEEAELHLKLFSEAAGANSELLGQIAYCQGRQGQFSKAINTLRQALILDSDNPQLLFQLQFCYARTGRYEQQLECLLQLEKSHPDEPKVLTETGLCLMQLQRWEEAQKRFYKMEFKGQRVIPSVRAIAWCALRMGEYDVAERNYDRLLVDPAVKWEDFLNAAHIKWLQGQVKLALPLYHEYARRYATANPDAKDILTPFLSDVPVLREQGKSASDIHIMYDLIAREL